MSQAETIVWLVEGYLAIGLAVAACFLIFGIERVEPYSKGSLGFRPLLVPGLCLLWPLVLWRWRVLWLARRQEP